MFDSLSRVPVPEGPVVLTVFSCFEFLKRFPLLAAPRVGLTFYDFVQVLRVVEPLQVDLHVLIDAKLILLLDRLLKCLLIDLADRLGLLALALAENASTIAHFYISIITHCEL